GVQAEIKQWKTTHPDRFPADTRTFSLATGALFSDTLAKSVNEFHALTGIETKLHTMTNIRLGEGITAAGLLMAEDVLIQLKSVELGDIVILPRIMFDHPETVSLDDLSPQECANRLGKPVALVDTMGDIWDVVIGNSETVRWPAKK
ncbi:MAG: NifB/MoaA-like Fe-S oxidoreductase, partial [Candidatus Promineifilaceae bacterium]